MKMIIGFGLGLGFGYMIWFPYGIYYAVHSSDSRLTILISKIKGIVEIANHLM